MVVIEMEAVVKEREEMAVAAMAENLEDMAESEREKQCSDNLPH